MKARPKKWELRSGPDTFFLCPAHSTILSATFSVWPRFPCPQTILIQPSASLTDQQMFMRATDFMLN